MRYYQRHGWKQPPKIDDVLFHREKFDAVLKKIAQTKPLQRKELLGTFPASIPSAAGKSLRSPPFSFA